MRSTITAFEELSLDKPALFMASRFKKQVMPCVKEALDTDKFALRANNKV